MFSSLEKWSLHTLSHALTEAPEAFDQSKRHYLDLQQSEFYDQDGGQWKEQIGNALDFKFREISDQLLGVLIEASFSMEQAETRYRALEKSFYIGPTPRHWVKTITPGQVPLVADLDIFTELMGVWALSSFDKPTAQSRFDALKCRLTPLGWEQPFDSFYSTRTRLVGILVAGSLDHEAGVREFKDLQSGALWDPDKKLWSKGQDFTGAVDRWQYHSDTQLLGVIAESLFSPETAPGRLAALEASAFFDRADREWDHLARSDGEGWECRWTFDQLLGVLAAHKVSRLEALATADVIPLPMLTLSNAKIGGFDV